MSNQISIFLMVQKELLLKQEVFKSFLINRNLFWKNWIHLQGSPILKNRLKASSMIDLYSSLNRLKAFTLK